MKKGRSKRVRVGGEKWRKEEWEDCIEEGVRGKKMKEGRSNEKRVGGARWRVKKNGKRYRGGREDVGRRKTMKEGKSKRKRVGGEIFIEKSGQGRKGGRTGTKRCRTGLLWSVALPKEEINGCLPRVRSSACLTSPYFFPPFLSPPAFRLSSPLTPYLPLFTSMFSDVFALSIISSFLISPHNGLHLAFFFITFFLLQFVVYSFFLYCFFPSSFSFFPSFIHQYCNYSFSRFLFSLLYSLINRSFLVLSLPLLLLFYVSFFFPSFLIRSSVPCFIPSFISPFLRYFLLSFLIRSFLPPFLHSIFFIHIILRFSSDCLFFLCSTSCISLIPQGQFVIILVLRLSVFFIVSSLIHFIGFILVSSPSPNTKRQ